MSIYYGFDRVLEDLQVALGPKQVLFSLGEIYNWEDLEAGESFRSDGDAILSQYKSRWTAKTCGIPAALLWTKKGP